jgi:cytochrome c2
VYGIQKVGHPEGGSIVSKRELIGQRRPLQRAVFSGLLTLLLVFPACNKFRDFDFARGARLTGGNPEAGRKRMMMRTCGSCHVIPGVLRAEGRSAPSLDHWSDRDDFLDGRYKNTPENIEKWLEKPSHRKPGTNMPDMSLSPEESRDMTAYLFSIN